MRVIRGNPHSALRIAWPTVPEMEESERLLRKHPLGGLLPGVFAMMDGARFPCADYLDTDTQNAFYEGYVSSVEVTGILVFTFDGVLVHAGLNYAGSWHDSRVTNHSGFFSSCLTDANTHIGKAVLCDSAFAGTRARPAGRS